MMKDAHNADTVRCDHCGTATEYVMWCCPNEHVSVCQPCYLRMVKVESGDPIECPLRAYEVRGSDAAH
jgi:hypothetical protein